MPVSPQDFALWSRMTGNPYPQTPAERMALAPEVYSYTRNIGRSQSNPLGEALGNFGKIALAGGLLAGAALLGGAYLKSPGESSSPEAKTTKVTAEVPDPEPVGAVESTTESPTPQDFLSRRTAGISKYVSAMGGAQSKLQSQLKLELDNEPDIQSTVVEAMPDASSQVARNSGDVTGAKTADNNNQNVVLGQTSVVQELRGTNPQKPTLGPIEQQPATQSEVISSQQFFTPGTEEQQLASAAQPNPSIRAQAEELIGRVSASQVAKFRQSPSYAAAVKSAGTEELIGDDTPYVEPSPQPAVISGPVRMTPQTRVAVVKEESPIAAMSTAATPVTVTSPEPAQKIAVPVGGASSSEIRELDQLLARSHARYTPEQRIDLRNQLLAKKYGGGEATVEAPAQIPTAPIVTTSQPQPVRVSSENPVSEAKTKLFQKAAARPAATIPGTEEHLIAQAREHLEAVKGVGQGAFSQNLGGSSAIRNITVYPGNQISVTYKNDPETQYAFKSDPNYAEELKSLMHSGQFGPSGMHSAGGFIQAGINKGLLY